MAGPVWIVADNTGSRLIFTAEGAWVGSTSGAGDGIWIERRDGMAISMHSEWGRSVDLFYAQGRLAKAVASDGRSVSYAYDSHGRLVEVTRPDGVHRYHGTAGYSARLSMRLVWPSASTLLMRPEGSAPSGMPQDT